jgi:hypothetical protein
MMLGLSVFAVVLGVTIVLGLVGYLIDRSAFGSGQRGGR